MEPSMALLRIDWRVELGFNPSSGTAPRAPSSDAAFFADKSSVLISLSACIHYPVGGIKIVLNP